MKVSSIWIQYFVLHLYNYIPYFSIVYKKTQIVYNQTKI